MENDYVENKIQNLFFLSLSLLFLSFLSLSILFQPPHPSSELDPGLGRLREVVLDRHLPQGPVLHPGESLDVALAPATVVVTGTWVFLSFK